MAGRWFRITDQIQPTVRQVFRRRLDVDIYRRIWHRRLHSSEPAIEQPGTSSMIPPILLLFSFFFRLRLSIGAYHEVSSNFSRDKCSTESFASPLFGNEG